MKRKAGGIAEGEKCRRAAKLAAAKCALTQCAAGVLDNETDGSLGRSETASATPAGPVVCSAG